MESYLLYIQQNALLAFVGIIILSYILEDLAIVTAAILASNQVIPNSLGLIAIFVGIASGDLLLYGLGYLAQKRRGLRYRLLTASSMRYVRRRLQQQTMLNIFIIRFVPGLRTISFTLCGFFQIRLWSFLIAVLLATALWTAIVFSLIYQLGSTEWLQQSELKSVLGPIAFILLILFNRFSRHKTQSSSKSDIQG